MVLSGTSQLQRDEIARIGTAASKSLLELVDTTARDLEQKKDMQEIIAYCTEIRQKISRMCRTSKRNGDYMASRANAIFTEISNAVIAKLSHTQGDFMKGA